MARRRQRQLSPSKLRTAAPDSNVTIEREIDGDSLELRVDGEVVEVRLLGINAPELMDCSGPAARDALGGLLARGNLSIVGGETDRFGRELVWLEANGLDVSAAMVEAGWALANHNEGDGLVPSMQAAADAGIGAWAPGAGNCAPPTGNVQIVDAEPDPAGPDDQRMNDEYVVLANAGGEAVDLTGWIVRDESTGNPPHPASVSCWGPATRSQSEPGAATTAPETSIGVRPTRCGPIAARRRCCSAPTAPTSAICSSSAGTSRGFFGRLRLRPRRLPW